MDEHPPDVDMSNAQQESGTAADDSSDTAEADFARVQAQLHTAGLQPLQNAEYAMQHEEFLIILDSALEKYLDRRARGNHHPKYLTSVHNCLALLRPSTTEEPRTNPDEAQRWEKAFKGDFKSTSDYENFVHKLEDIAIYRNPLYARVLPIIQSSGAGKSRMLDNAAETIFTFPLCLRLPDEGAYPPDDPEARKYLCKPTFNKTTVLLFLKHLAKTCLARLSARPELQTPSTWRAYLNTMSNRNAFYSEVCTSAEQDQTKDKLKQAVQDEFTTLVTMVKSPFFMIYIDEAHHLEKPKQDRILKLQSAMADVVPHKGHVLVLTSTNSQLSSLAPAPGNAKAHQSFRWDNAPIQNLPQVWTTFPFKIFNRAPPQGTDLTPAHARSFEVAADLGRPLWGASMRHGVNTHDDLSANKQKTAELAFIKLTKELDVKESPSGRAFEAALVCRLYLGIERSNAGTDFASDLVESRMATALYVEQSRASLAACYSVEPILAWAAFQVIACFGPDLVLFRLKRLAESGLIERGPRGELMTKFAVMRAYDSILKTRFSPGFSYEGASKIPHFSPVTLKDFLERLSGRRDLIDSYDIAKNVSLKELEGCSTVLAQWTGSIGDETAVNVNLAVQAMLSHCGVQMPTNMPGVDHMLVFCRDENKRIAPSNLVVVLLQSKNRNQFRTVKVPQRVLDRFVQEGVPVIFILHEVDAPFGMKPDEDSVSQSRNFACPFCLSPFF